MAANYLTKVFVKRTLSFLVNTFVVGMGVELGVEVVKAGVAV